MHPRLFPRARRELTALLVGGLLAGGVWAGHPAAAAPDDIPPQEPGVTLRVFDTQVPLSTLCTLKPGQTPNHDKLMPAVDWSTTDDFGGFADNFVAEASGYLVVPEDGTYAFRLTSDDGSRLTIDDQEVIDHDGLHGAEPKDGSAQLTAGFPSVPRRLLRARRRPAADPRLETPGRGRLHGRPAGVPEHRRRRREGHRAGP